MNEGKNETTAAETEIDPEVTEAWAEAEAADLDLDFDELAVLRAERDELKDKLLRAYAEVENLRKRAERERREAEQFGGSRLARDILPVYDNLQRALDAATEEQREAAKALFEGVELTLREIRKTFEKHGIQLVAPEIGAAFDPQLHEAMFEAPVPGTTAGEIIQVLSHGFMHHDRLLRPAQVGVSSTPPASGESAEGQG
ncbi:MAG: nucleotide exchange factor GrpE [Alphaproteobacteria bacterium]|nr:MAG: nucleotide exchange factor GrpE [Alphaproteobacteria bacterium]